jgi:NAD(P)-dependent dehydrogenase (short-subunit alcohol dehydrogenase family)
MTQAASWRDRVVVVTGASSGIGAALAGEVSRRGGTVVLTARRADKLAEVAAPLVPRLAPTLVVPGDVTRREDVDRVLAAAVDRFGKVDVWVNNAGRGITRSVEELTDEDVDTMIADNLKSALYGMQAAAKHFRDRRAGQIVNVSSMLARAPYASFRSAYSASKAALNSITESLRLDLARDVPDVVVTCVMPGVVATDFGLNAFRGGADSRSFPHAQSVEEVVAIIADAIEHRRGGDIYTRPDAADRVVAHLRALASTGAGTT